MPAFEDFYFESTTGRNTIRARKLVPDGELKGIVQIAHGIAEHIERYDDFMAFLAENGYLSVGNDHLGHGMTASCANEKGLFAEEGGWNYAVMDMHKLHNIMAEQYPGKKYILFGHSMGSFLARTYIINYPDGCDMAILSGTGNQSALMISGGCIISDVLCLRKGVSAPGTELNDIAFGNYLNRIENARTQFDWLSRDPAVVDKYAADENCGFVAKNGLYRDMMHGIQYITAKKNIAKMNKAMPVYFMSGKEDPVGDYGKGVEKAYKLFCNAGCQDVTIRLYEGGRHEMLNETNKSDVYNDILSWITARV